MCHKMKGGQMEEENKRGKDRWTQMPSQRVLFLFVCLFSGSSVPWAVYKLTKILRRPLNSDPPASHLVVWGLQAHTTMLNACGAGDPIQGLVELGKHSATELHPTPTF